MHNFPSSNFSIFRLIRRLEKWLDLAPGTSGDSETPDDTDVGPSHDRNGAETVIHMQQDPTTDSPAHKDAHPQADASSLLQSNPTSEAKDTDPKCSLKLDLESSAIPKSQPTQPKPMTQGQTDPIADRTTQEPSGPRADVTTSTQANMQRTTKASPAPYALFPLSRGFVISLRHTLQDFKAALHKAGIS